MKLMAAGEGAKDFTLLVVALADQATALARRR